MSEQKDTSSACGVASELNDELGLTCDEMRAICDATVRLTELRQRGCLHLCIENVAPEIFRKLLAELRDHKKTMHWSDCALHNEPAYPNKHCDCGGFMLPNAGDNQPQPK